jgi:hypothetical protein
MTFRRQIAKGELGLAGSRLALLDEGRMRLGAEKVRRRSFFETPAERGLGETVPTVRK